LSRLGDPPARSSSRIRGGSASPPLVSAAAFRCEINFAGGFVGRDRLGTTISSSPDTVNWRCFVCRFGIQVL
jgi:hypothetical protein